MVKRGWRVAGCGLAGWVSSEENLDDIDRNGRNGLCWKLPQKSEKLIEMPGVTPLYSETPVSQSCTAKHQFRNPVRRNTSFATLYGETPVSQPCTAKHQFRNPVQRNTSFATRNPRFQLQEHHHNPIRFNDSGNEPESDKIAINGRFLLSHLKSRVERFFL